MNRLTTERLEKFVSDIKTDGMCNITDYQVALALRQLLAYEQAADRPVGEIFRCSGNKTLRWWNDVPEGTVLYAAPVLPKQPELIGMKVSIDTGSDNIGHRLFGEIVGTSDSNGVPVLCIEVTENNGDMAAPAQPVIPEQCEVSKKRLEVIGCGSVPASIDEQRSMARTLLSAQPVSEPYKLPSGYALVPCKLTAENGAKSCMIGKFIEQTEISCPECFGDDECETCDGSGTIEVTAHVSWTTIKDIWAKGIEHFAAAPAQESE